MRVRVGVALVLVASIIAACSEGPSKPGTAESPGAGGNTSTSALGVSSAAKSKGGAKGSTTKAASSAANPDDTDTSTGDTEPDPDNGSSGSGTTSSASRGGSGSGGTSSTSSGSGKGGATASSASTQTVSTEECTDIQTADHQGEPCSIWVDWGHCNADWLQGFCNKTCGRCSGSGKTTTGAGGSSGGVKSSSAGGSVGATTSVGAGPTVARLGNDAQSGYATRYWDCCKPHCAWQGNSNGNLRMCTEQNQSLNDASAKSSCDGGPAYTCWDMAPWAVSDTLAYGYAATPGNGNDCGKCYQLDFTGESKDNPSDAGAKAISTKTMIVQATNKGYDVAGGQFDLLIPGGGVGAFNGCSKQWGVDNSQLGSQYGGFALACNYDKECTRKKCQSVFNKAGMEPLQKGCLFYVDWLQTADNPRVRYKQVSCPSALTSKSGISG